MGKALLCGMIFDNLSNFVSWFKEDSCMMLTANLYCGSVKMLELALGKLQPVSCHSHQTNLELSRWWLFWVCIFFFFFFFFAEWKYFIKERVEKQHQHLPKLHPKDSEELSLGQRNQKCYSTKTSGPIYGQPC